ncbi:hypothetical protein ASF92_09660 [Pedobacter sp. Leaf176]|nr:hypothetical protein ASF92_09660 [Pedobacter sp. Leaf176]
MPVVRHAICTMLPGLADFRRKKHGNLCRSFNYRRIQGRIKRARWDEQRYQEKARKSLQVLQLSQDPRQNQAGAMG